MAEEKQSSRERRHHFLPQFYLGGFTDKKSKKGRLWVLDLQELKQWHAKPKDIAVERDLYRVDTAEVEPLELEKAFARVESQAAPVIRSVIAERQMPTGADFSHLMEFIATMVVRIPRLRNQDYKALSEFIDGGREFAKRLKEHPEDIPSFPPSLESDQGVPLEDLAAVCETKEKFTHELHFQSIVTMMPILIQLLSVRPWSVWEAPGGSIDFICSDSPVMLQWIEPLPGPFGPGFGQRNTYLTFPLSSRLALSAAFEIQGRMREASRESVAQINAHMVASAERFLFSRHKDFVWMKPGGSIGTGSEEFLEMLRAVKQGAGSDGDTP